MGGAGAGTCVGTEAEAPRAGSEPNVNGAGPGTAGMASVREDEGSVSAGAEGELAASGTDGGRSTSEVDRGDVAVGSLSSCRFSDSSSGSNDGARCCSFFGPLFVILIRILVDVALSPSAAPGVLFGMAPPTAVEEAGLLPLVVGLVLILLGS